MNLNNYDLEKLSQQDDFKIIQDVSQLELPEYIDQPEYVRRKAAGYGLMALGWTLWMWLFMPLLTLIFWWFEVTVFYTQVVEQTQPLTSISVLKLMVCIGIFISILFVWASYNWVRFHGEDRRKAPNSVTADDLAQSFQLQSADIVKLRQAKNITLHYSDEGQLQDYQLNAQPQLSAKIG